MIINVEPRNTKETVYFPNGGYYFLKNEVFSLAIPVIDANKKNKNGHIHFDIGSVTISYRGVPVIVDPGTHTYTRDMSLRKKDLQHTQHNIPLITNGEIKGFTILGFFNSIIDNRITILEDSATNLTYQHNYFSFPVKRKISVLSQSILITDTSDESIQSYFHLDSGFKLIENITENELRFRSGDTKVQVISNSNMFTTGYDYSKGYGEIIPGIRIIVESNGCNEMRLYFHDGGRLKH